MAKKQLKGTIVSNKMQKTVVVNVERIVESGKYKKRYKVQKGYKADTGKDNFNVGDVVLIEECKPISKDKKWKVIKKIRDSKLVDLEPVETETI
jgi:small subunit ribosomal protein S17